MSKEINIIHSYTRQDAIRDGVLVDVTELAKQAGFRWPVAMTSTVHGKFVVVPPTADWQDEMGRLWDILTMLRLAIRQCETQRKGLLFSLQVNNGEGPRTVRLKALRGYDDDGRPCVTIMLPEED